MIRLKYQIVELALIALSASHPVSFEKQEHDQEQIPTAPACATPLLSRSKTKTTVEPVPKSRLVITQRPDEPQFSEVAKAPDLESQPTVLHAPSDQRPSKVWLFDNAIEPEFVACDENDELGTTAHLEASCGNPDFQDLDTYLSGFQEESLQKLQDVPILGESTMSPSNGFAENKNRMLQPISDSELQQPEKHHLYSLLDTNASTQVEQKPIEMNLNSLNTAGRPSTWINFSDTPENNDSFSTLPELDAAQRQLPAAVQTPATGLIIHPPMIQPYNKNQHTFVVENKGTSIAKDVVVEITVSETAKIVAALPANSASSRETAVFNFDQIAVGDHVQVHVTAISNNQEPIAFVAHLVTRSTHNFDVHRSNTPGRFENVSYHLNSVSTQSDVQAIPEAVAESNSVRVRNPYFEFSPRQNYEARMPSGHR